MSVVCLKYKEMYGRILKGLNIINLHRGMSKLKLKICCVLSFLWLYMANLSDLATRRVSDDTELLRLNSLR